MTAVDRVERPEGFALGVMFAAGAALALIVPLVPHGGGINLAGWVVNSSLAFPVALLLMLRRDRVPAWAYHGLLVVGGVVVANGIWFGNGGPASIAASFFYIWVPLYAFWAWDWHIAAGHVLLDAVLLAVALNAAGVAGAVAVWLIIVGTAGIAGLVVGLMRRNLAALATIDPLTRLPNRHSLHDTLQREIARARRHGSSLVVAILDIDEFKAVNDEQGHQAGDALLRSAAAGWRAVLRASDVLVRFGGDEFVVVMPATTASQAQEIVDRLHSVAPLGFTVGIAEWAAGEDPDALIGRADAVLYAGKRARPRRGAGNDLPSIAPALRVL